MLLTITSKKNYIVNQTFLTLQILFSRIQACCKSGPFRVRALATLRFNHATLQSQVQKNIHLLWQARSDMIYHNYEPPTFTEIQYEFAEACQQIRKTISPSIRLHRKHLKKVFFCVCVCEGGVISASRPNANK